MKIGIVGCGALGSYYGAKLCRDGNETHFLLRSDYDIVRRNGVRILSDEGNFHVNPKCARGPHEIGICDLILIALKTTANHQFSKLIPPLVGEKTAILTLQNGLGNEAQLAKLFGAEKILGGLCFICLNRIEPGVVRQTGAGKMVMGEFQRWPEPRTHDIAAAFRHAGTVCKVADDLERAHWEKLVWNIPFNGLGVAGAVEIDSVLNGKIGSSVVGACLATDALLSDARWEKLVRELMAEIIATAQALGLKVKNDRAEKEISRTRKLGSYKASTLIDFERRQPLELDALFLEPLRQAKICKVPTPRLSALCKILQELDSAGEIKTHR